MCVRTGGTHFGREPADHAISCIATSLLIVFSTLRPRRAYAPRPPRTDQPIGRTPFSIIIFSCCLIRFWSDPRGNLAMMTLPSWRLRRPTAPMAWETIHVNSYHSFYSTSFFLTSPAYDTRSRSRESDVRWELRNPGSLQMWPSKYMVFLMKNNVFQKNNIAIFFQKIVNFRLHFWTFLA